VTEKTNILITMKLSWIVIVVCVLAALLTGSYLSYEEDNEIMYVIPTDVKKKQISHDSALSAIFVHIGKTGGSSARCILHTYLREEICKQEDNRKKFASKALGEGYFAIRERANAMIHMDTVNEMNNGTLEQFKVPNNTTTGNFIRDNFRIAIVSIRDPVERIVSWFLYTKKFKQRGIIEELFGPIKCNYTTTSEFFSDTAAPKEARTECQKIAVACVSGEMNCGGHNNKNFTYYLQGLVDDDRDELEQLPSIRIFAIRNEEKWQDMEKTNLILGGSAQAFTWQTIENTVMRKSREDRTIHDADRVALCTLLCSDLYYYSKVVHQAENLHRMEKGKAIKMAIKAAASKTLPLSAQSTT